MGRNLTKQVAKESTPDGENQSGEEPTTTMPGGAPGLVDTTYAERTIGGPQTISSAARTPSEDEPKAKWWRVTNGGSIMYAGSRVGIRAGRLVAEHQADLSKWRAQGIILVEAEAP